MECNKTPNPAIRERWLPSIFPSSRPVSFLTHLFPCGFQRELEAVPERLVWVHVFTVKRLLIYTRIYTRRPARPVVISGTG